MMHQQLPEGTKAMLFAAGLGTRLRPFTIEHPKALFPIHGKTLLQRNIEHLKSFGIKDIIINIHHFAEQIIAFTKLHNDFDIRITFSHEKEEALETGGGLKKASWFFSDTHLPFVVMNADILSNIDLYKMYLFHLQHNALATLAATSRNSSRVLLKDEMNRLIGWRQKNTGEKRMSRNTSTYEEVAFSGIQFLDPKFLKKLNPDGKFSIIDAYLDLAITENIWIYSHDGDIVVDVGKPEMVSLAEKLFP